VKWGPGGPITKRELDELRAIEARRERREKIRSWVVIVLCLATLAAMLAFCAGRPS
jgi:hypothetical protein